MYLDTGTKCIVNVQDSMSDIHDMTLSSRKYIRVANGSMTEYLLATNTTARVVVCDTQGSVATMSSHMQHSIVVTSDTSKAMRLMALRACMSVPITLCNLHGEYMQEPPSTDWHPVYVEESCSAVHGTLQLDGILSESTEALCACYVTDEFNEYTQTND